MPKSSREEVFAAINGERAYQNALWSGADTDQEKSVHAFIVFMDAYMTKAKAAITQFAHPKGTNEALEAIRKATALGVACMEANGAIPRASVTPQEIDFTRHGIEE